MAKAVERAALRNNLSGIFDKKKTLSISKNRINYTI